jgi:exonuclease SbcC
VIPQRVKLKGFLCYKSEQVVEFDGNATLWMLSGLNGSGKSSIFDAITYALFGHHRGGGQHAAELINKDCDTMLAEFDFLLDGQRYRVKRTLRRDTRGGARGTQQIFRFERGGAESNGRGSWVAVEGTSQRREFDTWVADNIGLNYETFTSSVLLLQGKAEKLLDSKPEGRREVLARIVDLERYEQLHRKADDQRKNLEGQLKTLNQRLAALPAVPPLEVILADKRIEEAEATRGKARAEVERLQKLEYDARHWRELQQRLEQERARFHKAEALLKEAPEIEQAIARLRELREVLPRLNEITLLRGKAHQAQQTRGELSKQKSKLLEQLAQRENEQNRVRSERTTLQSVISADEARQREVVSKLRACTEQMTRLQECEQQEALLARLRDELSQSPADPVAAVHKARAIVEEVQAVARVVPVLLRFQQKRAELIEAIQREEAGCKEQEEVKQRGEKHAAEVERLTPGVEEAARVMQEANDQVTTARTLLTQARASLRELSELDGSKVCRHCGQALTEGHLKEEKRRRTAEVQAVEARLAEARQVQKKAQAQESEIRRQHEQASKSLQEARAVYRDWGLLLKQAQQDVERLRGECAQAHAELPEPFRIRVRAVDQLCDWSETTYPTEADLDQIRRQAEELPRVQQELRQAEQAHQRWSRLKIQEETTTQAIGRLLEQLPVDREAFRREHQRLVLQDQILEKDLTAHRAEIADRDKQLEKLTGNRDQTQAEIMGLEAQLKGQEEVQQHARQTMAKVIRVLPESWHAEAETVGLREYALWEQEKNDLEDRETDARWQSLQQARLERDVLRQELANLEAEEHKFDPTVRQDPNQIVTLLSQARLEDRRCDEELSQAREQRALLESYRRQRAELDQEARTIEEDWSSQRVLSDLLGRERLQLYLVRQAERQVVEHANVVLDRLSGGQLYLKLVGETEGEASLTKALELEAYNRSTGEKPINVAFLSGSQKFRVAVSLALGIGQYASRQHRPIESVIIDEGFGCLDTQGRQVMVQELQNLRGQMRCILLVSHQEEFAEAFTDGYRFELNAGSTQVSRVQR